MVLDEVAGFAEDDDGAEHSEGEEANVRQEGDCNRALTGKLFKSHPIQPFLYSSAVFRIRDILVRIRMRIQLWI